MSRHLTPEEDAGLFEAHTAFMAQCRANCARLTELTGVEFRFRERKVHLRNSDLENLLLTVETMALLARKLVEEANA